MLSDRLIDFSTNLASMTDTPNGEVAGLSTEDSSPNVLSNQNKFERANSTPNTYERLKQSSSAANLVVDESSSASKGSSDNDLGTPPQVPSQPPPVVKRRAPPAVRRFAANNRHSTPVLPEFMRQSSPNLSREPSKTPSSAASSEVELERGFKYSNL